MKFLLERNFKGGKSSRKNGLISSNLLLNGASQSTRKSIGSNILEDSNYFFLKGLFHSLECPEPETIEKTTAKKGEQEN